MNTTLSETFKKLKEKLDKSNRIFITMSPPDGDSIGSALALYNEFTKLGKEVVVQSSFEIPKYLTFVPFVKFIVIDDVANVDFSSFDMTIMVDGGDAGRVVKFSHHPEGFNFPEGTFLVCFDHHATHTGKFDIDLIDIKSASTCQIVFDFFESAGIKMDANSATLLYTGMYTDTGGFMHSNSTPTVYRAAADVLEAGADRELVILNVEKTQNPEAIQLAAEGLKDMEIVQEDDFKYVIVTLKKELLDKYESDQIEDALNILKSSPGFIRNVEGTDFGIIINQNKDIVSVSFRARTERFDLAKVCERYGGGGHRNACAFRSRLSLYEVVDSLKEQIKIML